MIKLMAKIGRFNTVIILTPDRSMAALAAALIAVNVLNQQGFSLHTEIAANSRSLRTAGRGTTHCLAPG